MIGTTISHYRIIEQLGAGGMGEVYRARDIRLERDVAVKVLPPHLAGDPVALARFEREAIAVAALAHPNILSVFDVGSEGPTAYIVMELLEGATLRNSIAHGPLPARKVIDYGAQIADGLAAAHERGFIHRDLKPDNLFLTTAGRVKILDFGLAKEVPRTSHVGDETTLGTGTAPGVIMGTVGYMAPEQVRGQAADQRTDLFALGVVLYELLGGHAPFRRETPAETMTAILREDAPELASVESKIPVGLARLVQHCLEKNPLERFQSARDLAFSLQALSQETPVSGTHVSSADARYLSKPFAGWRCWLWLAATVALLALGVIVDRRWLAAPSRPEKATVLDLALPAGMEMDVLNYPVASFSNDGSQFVFVGSDKDGTALWLRSLAAATSVRLPGTEEAGGHPIWSPDNRYLLFKADNQIKKIELASGTIESLWTGPAEFAGSDELEFSGDWNTKGDILFSWIDLYRMPEDGGRPELLLKRGRDDDAFHASHWLPDGRHYLFYGMNRRTAQTGVYAGSVGSSERDLILVNDVPACYVDPGLLLFPRAGTLWVQRFDQAQLKLLGDAEPLLNGIERGKWGGQSLWTSKTNLAFAKLNRQSSQLTWFDRNGRETGRVGDPLEIVSFDLSKDATQVAASVGRFASLLRVGLIDATRNAASIVWRTDGPMDFDPRFNLEGTEVVFSGQDDQGQGVFRLLIRDQSRKPIRIQTYEEWHRTGFRVNPHDWSRDGRFILYGPSSGELRVESVAGSRVVYSRDNDFTICRKTAILNADESGPKRP